MSDIVSLADNETDQRKQNFAIRQLLERVPAIESDIATIDADISALQSPACFSAHATADQTGIADITLTQILFGTEAFDVGGHFASSAWTPPAGKVVLIFNTVITGDITASTLTSRLIFKDGSLLAQSNLPALSTQAGGQIVAVDTASGSNVYTAIAYVDLNSGTGTAVANTTNFAGFWISA